jgi:uncharacterized protein YjbJ (UPF0337 family)
MENEHEVDKVKGRVKKAAGDLTDDAELRRSGQRDETAGKVKEAVQHGKDKLDDVIDGVKERMDRK